MYLIVLNKWTFVLLVWFTRVFLWLVLGVVLMSLIVSLLKYFLWLPRKSPLSWMPSRARRKSSTLWVRWFLLFLPLAYLLPWILGMPVVPSFLKISNLCFVHVLWLCPIWTLFVKICSCLKVSYPLLVWPRSLSLSILSPKSFCPNKNIMIGVFVLLKLCFVWPVAWNVGIWEKCKLLASLHL